MASLNIDISRYMCEIIISELKEQREGMLLDIKKRESGLMDHGFYTENKEKDLQQMRNLVESLSTVIEHNEVKK